MGGSNGGVENIIENKEPPAQPVQSGGRRKNQKGGSNINILSNDYKNYIPDLYNLVVIKDKVSEFIWYVLTGFLVISNSHTYVMTIKCERTADELSKKLDSAMAKDKKKMKEKAKGKPKWKLGY